MAPRSPDQGNILAHSCRSALKLGALGFGRVAACKSMLREHKDSFAAGRSILTMQACVAANKGDAIFMTHQPALA